MFSIFKIVAFFGLRQEIPICWSEEIIKLCPIREILTFFVVFQMNPIKFIVIVIICDPIYSKRVIPVFKTKLILDVIPRKLKLRYCRRNVN